MTQEVLKLALEALERSVATCFDQYAHRQVMSQPDHFINQAITAIKEALAQEQECWCTTCRPITMADMRFVVCPDCDNKRCPKANDHRNACTNSNEVGQKGSSWEHVKPLAQPEQEPVAKYSDIVSDGGLDPRNKFDTTPPQRTWVGLTDDEIIDVLHPLVMADMSDEATDYEIARAIEAKLKERNV